MSSTKINPWKILDRKIYTHTAYRKIADVLYELPDGRQEWFSLSDAGKAACALALTEDQQIILARQFRPGPNLVLDELPGGAMEPDERPEDAIRREMLEETGYAPGKLQYLGQFFECSYSNVERHAFLALDCKQTGPPKMDRNEFIETILKPIPEFMEQIQKGLATDLEVAWAGLFKAGLIGMKS